MVYVMTGAFGSVGACDQIMALWTSYSHISEKPTLWAYNADIPTSKYAEVNTGYILLCDVHVCMDIPHSYKFSRGLIFAVFADQCL